MDKLCEGSSSTGRRDGTRKIILMAFLMIITLHYVLISVMQFAANTNVILFLLGFFFLSSVSRLSQTFNIFKKRER